MISNYIKIAFRNLLKNKVFSLINIFGLALGMAACLLIWQYVRFELSYDKFHAKADRLYRVTLDYYSDGQFIVSDVGSHNTIGPAARKDIPGVENYARLFPAWSYSTGSDTRMFTNDVVMFADSSFTSMFDLQWVKGSPEKALAHPHSAIITTEIAEKYFPGEEAFGRHIKYLDSDNDLDIKVAGVIKSLPAHSHLHFDILISRHTPLQEWGLEPNWDGNNDVTYILLEKNTDPARVASGLGGLLKKYQPQSTDRYIMQNIQDIHLYSDKTYELEKNGNGKLVYALLGVSFFILIIAWINFINLSTARSLERAKEVGIRKTMGSVRAQLIKQFMIESIVINVIAILLAITFSQLMNHVFSVLVGRDISQFSIFKDGVLIAVTPGLLLVGCICTGLYPAFVLSSYQPVVILKGKFSSSQVGQKLRKSLVFFQYALATVLMTGVIMFYKQYIYMQRQDLGLDINKIIAVKLPIVKYSPIGDSIFNENSLEMKQKLMDHHLIKGVAMSETLPGNGIWEFNSTRGIRQVGAPANQHNYYFYRVDEAFFPLLGIGFAAGRNFRHDALNTESTVINESARKLLGFEDNASAIGKKIRWWGEDIEVIGVVKDHHHHSLDKTIDPTLYRHRKGQSGDYVTIKTSSHNLDETIQYIKEVYQTWVPEQYFDYRFMADVYDGQYESDRVMARSFTAFSLLAIFIACLGLFGLSYFTISQRTKEIGVRKVLGASVMSLCKLLTFRFLSLVGTASVIVIPITYYLGNAWLERYAFKTQLDWWIYLLPTLVMVMIAVGTVATHTVRAASANPVDSLKYE